MRTLRPLSKLNVNFSKSARFHKFRTPSSATPIESYVEILFELEDPNNNDLNGVPIYAFLTKWIRC